MSDKDHANARARIYYKNNREEILNKRKQRRLANFEQSKTLRKEYYDSHLEYYQEYRDIHKIKAKKYAKEYYVRNKDKILTRQRRQSNEYYLKNREQILERQKTQRAKMKSTPKKIIVNQNTINLISRIFND